MTFMLSTKTNRAKGVACVRFGSKADICAAQRHVRFTPKSDRESGFPQTVMSALPPKADMCGALADVCFGPIADILDAAEMLFCARNLGVSSFTQ